MKFLAAVLLCLSASALSAQTTVTLEPVKDNTLFNDPFFGALSNGAGTRLIAGVNAIGEPRRAVLAFDVASVVPAGATITAVSLELEVAQSLVSGSSYSLHLLLQDWGEGASVAGQGQGIGGTAAPGDATWLHTFSPGSLWTVPGGDFLPLPSATAAVGGVGNRPAWTSAAMVAEVQSWLDNPASSFGWLVKIDDESTSFDARAFSSREEPDATKRPKLTVTYTAGGPAASATSVGTGCPAASGAPCVLSTIGLPQLGNLGFALEATGPADGSQAYLYFANASSPVPTPISPLCSLWLELSSALAYVGAGTSPFPPVAYSGGSALWPFPLPAAPALAGFPISLQVINIESGLFLSATNAVDLVLGL